ncbi:GMC family oxidoreductase N-terminal domain-containing protein [Massilia sp. IC2-477]|uniref:GMC family oxidoreductase n=1 Tax=Massilia sp. IC2-477 TaxID=2887198 RepID=UPI001D105B3B|nr:GMC family oxidoreductase N-terminal domain-containing protein [Massilia sp. IC2-477]MCC2958601.1 GMC family oxidoreductase N-terminal domain-containing protein [Massilia sp. IC2-477]
MNNENQERDMAQAIRTNQAALQRELASHYDFIVCGAGSSGSVVAARLAENPAVRVLLLEAGGSDEVASVTDPAQWPLNLGSERDWNFAAEPNPHLNGRAIPMNMGRVLGGGSSINVMLWARGHRSDWNYFAAEAGDPAWNYDAVLGIYRRIEDWHGPADPERRGSGGPVYVAPARDPQPTATRMLEAARSLGIPSFDSPNGAMMEGDGGAAINDLRIRDGKRLSVFRSYTWPRMAQPNLTVLTDAQVARLSFDGARVSGVDVLLGGRRVWFGAAREVVLSLGAVNTPKVLMQSGLGPERELKRHGIAVRQHLAGVGQNHQDHVSFGCIWEYAEPQQVGNGGSEATLYWKSHPSLDAPDMLHCQVEFPVPSQENAGRGVPAHGWTMFAGLAHPKSRGEVLLSGPDPRDRPLIRANTLSDPDDMRAALASVEMCRELGNADAFRSLVKGESMPGKLSREAMEQYLRNGAVTYWHQSGTAKMGRDAMSVVNGALQVYGVDGLRIADASIMPRITTGNTMAPCVVIGERAAELLKAAHGI